MARSADVLIRNARAVLPDRVLENASVLVRDGVIVEIRACRAAAGAPPTASNATATDAPATGTAVVGPAASSTTAGGRKGRSRVLDARGAYLLPGFVDLHTDALETALAPRAGAWMPEDFALAQAESVLCAAGVSTAWHSVALGPTTTYGAPLPAEHAQRLHRLVRSAPEPDLEHRVLHRVSLTDPRGLDALRELLAEPGPPPLVSVEDHSPGQGQYRDPEVLVRHIVAAEGLNEASARARVRRLSCPSAESAAVRERVLAGVLELAAAGRVRLALHDPHDPRAVAEFAARGGHGCEFPTTRDAAVAAHRAGLPVICGAPNLVRGASHAGNVSVRELVADGLVTALVSDYQPGTLAAAVGVLVAGGVSWPRAVALVTSGPAAYAGLTDRGMLREGLRADLVLLDIRPGRRPRVLWRHHAGPAGLVTSPGRAPC